jgi:spermidine synthase
MGLLGFVSILGQTVLLREVLVLLRGNEIYIGVFYSGWFLGIAAGAWFGGRVRPTRGRLRLAGVHLGMLPGWVVLLRLGRPLLGGAAGSVPHVGPAVLLLLLVSWAYGLGVGAYFPQACGLLASNGGRSGRGSEASGAHAAVDLGRAYALEAAGALLGGALFSLVFSSLAGGLTIAAFTGALAVALTRWSTMGERGRPLREVLLLGALLAAAALGPWLDGRINRLRLASLAPGQELEVALDTPYGHVDITRREGQYTVFTDGQPGAPFPDPYSAVPQAAGVLAQHPDPRRVLLLGGGEEGLVAALLAMGVERIVVVETDRAKLEAVRAVLDEQDRAALEHPGVTVRIADCRRYVRTTEERFDVVVLLLPEPATGQLNRFYTVEFFRETRRILAEPGVLALSFSCSVHSLGQAVGAYGGTLFRTLAAVYPEVIAAPGDTCRLFAATAPGVVSDDPEVLIERCRERRFPPGFSVYQFAMDFPPDQTRRLAELLAGSDAPLNRDREPVAYVYNILLWYRQLTGRDAEVVREALRRARGRVIPLLAALWVLGHLGLGIRLRRSSRGRSTAAARLGAYSLAVTGFAAFGAQLLLLFGYQSIFGSLYRMVALANGLFMAGLALGGGWATRLLRARQRDPGRLLGRTLLLFGVLLLALPSGLELARAPGLAALPGLAGQLPSLVLFLITGFATGMVFPLAGAQLTAVRASARAAGLAEAMDHLGACLGGPFAVLIMLPLLGTAGAARSMALAVLSAALLWQILDRGR